MGMTDKISPAKEPVCIEFDRMDRRIPSLPQIAARAYRKHAASQSVETELVDGIFWTKEELDWKAQTVVVFENCSENPYIQTR